MEQLLETFGINWQLLIIQMVNFGVLLIALWYFLYRPISRMLEERQQKIAEGVEAAEAAHEKLARADAEHRDMLTRASQESEGIVASARERAAEKAEAMVHDAQSRADGIMTDAAARAEESQRQAMKESENEIARAAILAAEKLLKEKMTQ